MTKTLGIFFALLVSSAFGITSEEIGCDGGADAVGTPVSSLEEAGFQAVIQTLIIDPEVPISITTDANYKLRIVAPGDLFFNAFLMRAEFDDPATDSVVIDPSFSLTPSSSNAMASPICIGNILALVHKDTQPKEEVEGRFRLEETGDFVLDLTVVVEDEFGTENIYHSRYTLQSAEELPDIPTVTPKLLTETPTSSPVNVTDAPVGSPGDSPVSSPGGSPVSSPVTSPMASPAEEPTVSSEPKSDSVAHFLSALMVIGLSFGTVLL